MIILLIKEDNICIIRVSEFWEVSSKVHLRFCYGNASRALDISLCYSIVII